MLRRSLSVLVLLSLLGLGMILAYAAWNKSAHPKALDHAEELLERGKSRDALTLLNHLDRSLGPEGAKQLRLRLHDLRYRAREDTKQFKRALVDVQLLLDSKSIRGAKRTALRCAKVRMQLEVGERKRETLERTLQEVEQLRADAPEDNTAIELAGRTQQALYTLDLEELVRQDFLTVFGEPDLDDAIRDLIAFLYKDRSDYAAIRARRRFIARLRERIPEAVTHAAMTAKIDKIQASIAQSNEYYRQALRGQKPAFAAFQGYTGMLLRAGRLDEAAVISWLYLRRFPDSYGSVIAASNAMDAYLQMGNAKLALAAGRFWMQGGVEDLLEDFEIDRRLVRALVLLARAAYAQGDTDLLEDLNSTVVKIEAKNKILWPWGSWIRGCCAAARGDASWLEQELEHFCKLHETPPREGRDLFLDAMRLRLQFAKKTDPNKVVDVLGHWIKLRPGAVEPRLQRARAMIDQKKAWLAAQDLERVINANRAPVRFRDQALGMLLEARDEQYLRSSHDSKSEFQRLIATRQKAPGSLPDPVLHIGIARHALAAGEYEIARANLQEASEHFHWSTTVRLEQARLNLATKSDALHDVTQVLKNDPDNLEARLVELDILEADDRDPQRRREAELALITRHAATPQAAARFATHLFARRAWKLALEVGTESQAAETKDGAIAWLKGRALLGLDKSEEAIDLLVSVPEGSRYRVSALELAIEAATRLGSPSDVSILRKKLVEAQPTGDVLLRVAEVLIRNTVHLKDAYELLLRLDQDPAMSEHRNGKLYVLLGRVRYALNLITLAQTDWGAAYGFADGDAALPLLALSYLLDGKPDRARESLAFAPKPVGHPLTLAYLHYSLGNGSKALDAMKGFESSSVLLKSILMRALELAIDPKANPSSATPYHWINELIGERPKAIFEALALAPGLAFRARSKEAMQSLTEAAGDKPERKATVDLLWAYRDLLADRKRAAAARMMQIAHHHTQFYPVYDDLIRLTEEIHPESLRDKNMVIRYFKLTELLPPELVMNSAFTKPMFEGLAVVPLEKGDIQQAENYLTVAHLAAPQDAGPLRGLVGTARRRNDTATALKRQLQILALRRNPSATDVRTAVTIALEALSEKDARDGTTELGKSVRKVVLFAKRWQEAEPTLDHPALGKAAVLLARTTASPDESESENQQAAIAALEVAIEPYADGRLPPRLDTEGLILTLEELQLRAELTLVLHYIDQLVRVDPSLTRLWIMRAHIERQLGDTEQAIESLAWIPKLLPQQSEIRIEMARLRGAFSVSETDPKVMLDALASLPAETTAVARALLSYRTGDIDRARKAFAEAAAPLVGREAWLRDVVEILDAGLDGSVPEELAGIRTRLLTRARETESTKHWSAVEIASQLEHLANPPAIDADELGTRRRRARARRPVPAGAGK